MSTLLPLMLFAVSVQSPRDTVASTLDELDVVAIKQDIKLREDAVSATVLSGKALDELNTVGLKGFSDVVPNFFIPDYGSRITSSIYVRGLGARMDHPVVGLNVDNVPYLNKNVYDFDLADIESMEMLRGPQSTLFGRNTMGGLISIQTLSPMRWQGWRAMAEGGRGNDYKASLGRYYKFNDNIATSLTGNFSYLGGFFRNLHTGKLLDKERSGGLRWKTNWRPTGRIYLQNVLSGSLLRQGGYPYEYVKTGEINYDDTCFYRRFVISDGLTLNYHGKGWNLTSITSVQHINDNMTLDQDFLPLPYFTITQKQNETAFTEDLVAKGSSGASYKWLAGLFGFYKHLDMTAPVTFKETGIDQLIVKNRNIANPDYPISWNSDSFVLNSDFKIPTYGIALYHESKYDVDCWHFSAGIRLDFERARLDYHSYCRTGYDVYERMKDDTYRLYNEIDIDINDTGRLHRQYFTWMPKVSVLYDLPGQYGSNVYASVSKGYKSGGFNTQMFSEVLQQRLMGMMGLGGQHPVDEIVGYKPEYSWNYEVGAHLGFIEGRLAADVSVFYIDCRNQQLTTFPDGQTTGRIMTNAGKTKSFGGELSVCYNISRKFALNVSYGYTNASFVKFNNGIENFAGKKLPYAPANTLFLQGIAMIPTGNGFIRNLTFDVNMRGTGKIYWNEENTLSQPLYALLGASATAEGSNWSLQFWGKNLTNTKYHTFYFLSMGNEFLQRGRPWQIGATVRLNFKS